MGVSESTVVRFASELGYDGYPGMRKALLLPATFVTSRFGIDYVTVLAKDGTATEVPVQIAPTAEPGRIEILSGVTAGDMLVAPVRGATGQ